MSSLRVKLGAAAPDYGTLEDDAHAVAHGLPDSDALGEGKNPEIAVSFHEVEYAVSTNCGRKFKTVLNGLR